MEVLNLIYLVFYYSIIGLIGGVILLMLVRAVVNFADLNPFGRFALLVRRWSEPVVAPVRRALVGFGFGANAAPFVAILLTILLGYFALQLVTTLLNTLAGMLYAGQEGKPIALVGYLLFGALSLYSLLIFIRIIFSWGMVSQVNPVMRLLVRATDPLLVPLRRIIPPLGMLDISPIVAFILIWLFQAAIVGTLLRGLETGFFR
ncbi:MAG: YggT family protein [Pyrinomonadaceae bacterium MAG19_C2-C3]|nr:YggT family protein [Pyrinomonadaceae bacterium MAG19_C2-C3]